jgi:hypothetical protein
VFFLTRFGASLLLAVTVPLVPAPGQDASTIAADAPAQTARPSEIVVIFSRKDMLGRACNADRVHLLDPGPYVQNTMRWTPWLRTVGTVPGEGASPAGGTTPLLAPGHDEAADCYYASRLKGEPAEGMTVFQIHPLERRAARSTVEVRI